MPRGKWRFSDIYKWQSVIPVRVGDMTLYELSCAQRGHNEANGAKPRGTGDISDDRLAEMGIAGFD